MDTQLIQLLAQAPMMLVVLWMLTKEQAAHAETRRGRDADNKAWMLLFVDVMHVRAVHPDLTTDSDIVARLKDYG